MQTPTVTDQARTAATLARLLADVLRERAALSPHRDALLLMIGHLHTAAESFETDLLGPAKGIPGRAGLALLMAMGTAEDTPEAGIDSSVFYYVTTHITGHNPPLPVLDARSPQLAAQAARLHSYFTFATAELAAADDTSGRRASLATLVGLHRRHLDLAAAIDYDNARPCHRR